MVWVWQKGMGMEVATRRREQEVWQACDDLWALFGDMTYLTGDAIRERLLALGKSRGSPNEIYKYRKTWAESRKVSSKVETGQDSTDPIFRAVRIVHENLQSESNEKIELLKAQHAQELFEKDEEIKALKQALNALMEEMLALKNNHEAVVSELAERFKEHLSEIEVRKALEREMSLQKVLSEQQIHAKDGLLKEIKEAHQHEILKEKKRFDGLLEERKLLGQEYSEKLTEQKIASYNLEKIIKEQSQSITNLEQEIQVLREKITDRDQKITWLIGENNKMAEDLSQKSAEVLAQKAGFQVLLNDRRLLNISLKRAELEVSKLRVMGKLWQGGHKA